MNPEYDNLSQIIRSRRTIKPNQFNGRQIPTTEIRQLLSLADWAPTHAYTEPWRFKIFAGQKVTEFCQDHAELYRENTDPEDFSQAKYDKLLHMGEHTSHIIIAIMQRGENPNIPALEEVAATSCAVQNLLLGATALGIAAYWGSGGMAYQPPMKTYLKIRAEDLVLGILYLGYTDKTLPEGKRKTPLKSKIEWM